LSPSIEVDHSFSNKFPERQYKDFYEKMTTYVNVILSQARVIDTNAKAATFEKVIPMVGPNTPFEYIDTNSTRAQIAAIAGKLEGLKVGIVGVGGTGSYVLDLVAKTPVGEVHLYDFDLFCSHNAFRGPGAPSCMELEKQPAKVLYFQGIYSKMKRGIFAHQIRVTPANVSDHLKNLDWIFLCVDNGPDKAGIVDWLLSQNKPFIDVGIGIEEIEGALTGSVRVTSATGFKNDHLNSRISFNDRERGEYDQNIQIAELNSLAASLAIVKWKKFLGFYHDLEYEHQMTYVINGNQIENNDQFKEKRNNSSA
jgi:hypothetical protein